tara:strand:+ start:180 stop:686 length:507 start_codon:yes stop_codon:yes gene_type:complete
MQCVFQIRDNRQMSKRERQFAIAAAHYATSFSAASCDVSRMRTLLQEQPSLLETVGPMALTMAATHFGTLDAVKFLLERGVDRLYDTQTGIPRKCTHEPISGAFEYGNFDTLRTLFAAGITDASACWRGAWADHAPWQCSHDTFALGRAWQRPVLCRVAAVEGGGRRR